MAWRLADEAGERPAAEAIDLPGGRMLRLPVRPGQALTYGGGVLGLR